MNDYLVTLKTYGAVLTTAVLGPAAVVASRVDERYADVMLYHWARGILAAAEVRASASGLENVPAGPCVFVSNHASHFDVLMVFAHVRKHIRFVAKKELFRIPIFGPSLRATGNIEVDRSGGGKDRQTLNDAVASVHQGVCVMFFPEGSRAEDGVLKPFKKGASILAIDAQVPVVPIGIAGTRDILPKGGKQVRGGQRAVLCVGAPIETRGMTLADRDSLTETLRNSVQRLLTRAQQQAQDP